MGSLFDIYSDARVLVLEGSVPRMWKMKLNSTPPLLIIYDSLTIQSSWPTASHISIIWWISSLSIAHSMVQTHVSRRQDRRSFKLTTILWNKCRSLNMLKRLSTRAVTLKWKSDEGWNKTFIPIKKLFTKWDLNLQLRIRILRSYMYIFPVYLRKRPIIRRPHRWLWEVLVLPNITYIG